MRIGMLASRCNFICFNVVIIKLCVYIIAYLVPSECDQCDIAKGFSITIEGYRSVIYNLSCDI